MRPGLIREPVFKRFDPPCALEMGEGGGGCLGLADLAPELASRALLDLFDGNELDPMTREWMAIGLVQYLRGQAGSLDEALGLGRPGCRSWRRQSAMAARDSRLAKAHMAVSADPEASDWDRSKRLAEQARKLVPVWHAQYRQVRRAPDTWEAWKRELFAAWRIAEQYGGEVPRTPEGMAAATKRASQYSVSQHDLILASRYFLE